MELAEGVVLDGHYRLLRMLGRGGMGEVWEAEHTRLPRKLAIKFLLGGGGADGELSMRFRREAEIASHLVHPSIVQVTDFNVLADGTAYLVMERLVGEDLRARLTRGALSLEEARTITLQVSSALELAHREGIVHRDLKPENIFLCREPDGALRAKVLDFGISKLQGLVTHATRDDRVLGTPGYMAPEQAMGKNSTIDGRTDLFALAAIVHEMLTGRGVFIGDTLAELCTKVLYHSPEPLDELLPNVPRNVAVAVATALAKDPAERQSEVRSFAAVFAAARSLEPSSNALAATVALDEPAALPTASARPARSEPLQPRGGAKRAGLGLLILLIAGLASFAFVRLRNGSAELDPAVDDGSTTARAPALLPAGSPFDASLKAPRPALTSGQETVDASEPTTGVEGAADAGASSIRARSVRSDSAASANRTPPSASVQQTLADAERALQSGDIADALRLARSTLRESPSERAYAVMARVYCEQRDVGMVRAMLRNVSASMRARVRQACAARGFNLP